MPDHRLLFVTAFFVVVAVVVAVVLGSWEQSAPSRSATPVVGPRRPAQSVNQAVVMATETPPTLHRGAAGTASTRTAVFTSASPALRHTARGFAVAWLGYDTRHEGRRTVLHRVASMVTPALHDRLRDSPRVHLPWQVLRERHERGDFNVVGISTRRTPQRHKAVVVTVNGIQTVHSDLAKLKTPTSLQLKLTRTPAGWQVADVHGGGA